jgi:hypothetical protein
MPRGERQVLRFWSGASLWTGSRIGLPSSIPLFSLMKMSWENGFGEGTGGGDAPFAVLSSSRTSPMLQQD